MATYTEENEKFLREKENSTLRTIFNERVAFENVLPKLLDTLEEISEEGYRDFMIEILSNENDFMLSELEEWANEIEKNQ